MRRRSPVRSVLAERKMFAGGGMLPISTPMKKEPSGILASSEPLIDAVSQEILAPMMGGAMPMAQGGIARFQTGGTTPRVSFNFNPKTFEVSPIEEKEFAPRAGKRTQIGIGASPIELRERLEKGPGELVNIMFPDEASSGAGFFGAQLSRPGPFGLGQEKGPSRPIVDLLRVPLDFLDQAARGLSQVNQKLGESLVDFGQAALSKRETGFINRLGQISAVNDALRKAPKVKDVPDDQLGSEISNFAKIAIAESPNITGDELSKRIAKDVFDKYEVGYSVAASDVGQDPDAVSNRFVDADNLPDPFSQEFKRDDKDLEKDAKDLEKDARSLENRLLSTKKQLTSKDFPGAVTEGTDPSTDPSESKTTLGADFDKLDMPEKEATKTLAAYKQEFMDEMPEYEGMSEAEKGFALMEAGLRVAAGESPNAITNVAKGLKGLGAQFAKDEKEKRAWNRQVNLSAAKYGLASAQKDRDREIALAAEGRKRPFELIATEDFVMDGQTIKKGQAVPLTNNQITAGYLNKFPLTYRETFISDAKAIAKLAEANKDNLLKPQNFSNDRKTYVENARSVKNGIRMKELLLEAANIAIPDGIKDNQILGAVPLFKSWVNKAFNAAGYQIDTAEGREKLSKLRSDKIDQYRTLMKTIGTTMVTEILNESNKTISEGDRQRVDDLVAAYSDFDGTFASYRSLLTKLKNLEKSIDSGISNASNSMRGIETQWGGSEFIGGGKASEVMQQIRQGVSAPGYSVGQKSSSSIPYTDIINMKTRKFTPKYQNIFGKQS